MPDRSGLRASDADRSQVVAQIQRHFQAGRLSLEELEERTRRAYVARTLGELADLTADLPSLDEVPLPPPPPPRPSVALGPWRPEVARFVSTMLLLVGIWALSGRGYFWPAWVMLAWGVRLVSKLGRGGAGPTGSAACRRRRHDMAQGRPVVDR